MLLDLLGIVVEDADAVGFNEDKEEDVDADKDPQEVIGELLAIIPLHPSNSVTSAKLAHALVHLVREEDEPS